MDAPPDYGLGHRHIQVALVFSMVLIGHITSYAIPTLVVAMTEPDTSKNPNIPSYPQWGDQSLVLVSFNWGLTPALLLSGPFSRKYGAKWFMILSTFLASMVSFAAPFCINTFGSIACIICFFIQGVCQGIILPMLSDFIGRWVPLLEVTTIGTWIFAGDSLGAVIATGVSGVLSSSWYGWPSVFYFAGTFGSIWCIFMVIFGYSNPDEHKSITKNELAYINKGKNITKKRIPWSYIMKSSPAWATWTTQVSLAWTMRLTASEYPTYINRYLGLNVATGSRILAIMYFMGYLNTFVISGISRYLISKKYLSVCASRKLCNSIACWGSAFCLILLGTFDLSTGMSLFLISLSLFCIPAAFTGFNINYNDLSPNYSACLIGIGGVAASIVSIIPVTLVQFMVTDQENFAQWGSVFQLAASITGLGNVVFVWLGEADIQGWDDLEDWEDRRSYINLDNESPIE